MKEQENRRAAFRQAAGVLPLRLQNAALRLPPDVQAVCEELRLRAGQGLRYSVAGVEASIPAEPVSADELQETLSRATRYSVHSFEDSLRQGFVTLEGGHRLGLCGTAIVRGGEFAGVRGVSSLNLRIASETQGAAAGVVPLLLDGPRVRSALIVSPPAWGKTTLLRDLVRLISLAGVRVGVADERGEIAGSSGGTPQFDLGPMTDVMSGGAKAEAALLLLKTMSPAVLALDEITSEHDAEAARHAAHCGAAVLATAHAYGFEDLKRRPLYRALLESAVFDRLVTITLTDGARRYAVTTMEGEALC